MRSFFHRLRSGDDNARLFNLGIFVILTLGIHYAFRWWAYEQHYQVLGHTVVSLETLEGMGRIVFLQTLWIVRDLLGIDVAVVGQIIYMPDGGGVAVDGSCSGLKQMLQFALLILLLPGAWKHKAWFIPLGILLIHITNVFRVFGLCMVMWVDPPYFSLFHDYLFRPLFYVVIFGLWLIWTERLRPRKSSV
jgi:exosortase/archaeosortase family protein